MAGIEARREVANHPMRAFCSSASSEGPGFEPQAAQAEDVAPASPARAGRGGLDDDEADLDFGDGLEQEADYLQEIAELFAYGSDRDGGTAVLPGVVRFEVDPFAPVSVSDSTGEVV